MGPRHDAKLFGVLDAGKAHEVAQVALIGAPRLPVRDIGKPLDLGRHVRKVEKLLGGQRALFTEREGLRCGLWFFHRDYFVSRSG